MGMSSRARLVYGYALGGDEDSEGWLIEEASEYGEWEPDWQGEDGITEAAEARMLASVGFTETDWEVDGYFDRQREAKDRLGVKFVHHGGEWSCVVLATPRDHRRVGRGRRDRLRDTGAVAGGGRLEREA